MLDSLKTKIAGAAILGSALLAMPASAFPLLHRTLPPCNGTPEKVSVDLSTTASPGADPYWTVNGGTAYHTPPYAYWTTRPDWIQPVASPTPSPNIPVGNYTYELQFTIPGGSSSYSNLKLGGDYLVDNYVTAFWLNATTNTGPTCLPNSVCWQSPSNGFAFSQAALHAGLNTLTVVVYNATGYPPPNSPTYSALSLEATLSGTCNTVIIPTQNNHAPERDTPPQPDCAPGQSCTCPEDTKLKDGKCAKKSSFLGGVLDHVSVGVGGSAGGGQSGPKQ